MDPEIERLKRHVEQLAQAIVMLADGYAAAAKREAEDVLRAGRVS